MEIPPQLFSTLVAGLPITLQVTAGAIAVATIASLVAGIWRLSRNPLLGGIATIYVEFFRGTSALVQLFWVYYVLPLMDINIEALLAGIVVLGLNTGAYGAEVVRGAIQAVDRGQIETATALGMSRAQILWIIILPQVVLAMLPPFGNLLIELLKNSALVSLITLADLTFQAQQILRTQYPAQTLLIFSLLLVFYFLIAQLFSAGVNGLERVLARGRDHGGMH